MRAIVIASQCLLLGIAGVAAAAEPTAAPVALVEKQQEIVCRKTKETGSLVKARKTCHTRGEWATLDDAQQRAGRQFVQDNTSRVGGN